ncbi:MAG: O-antigen ligase family protein [Planctomycetota bacterium]
MLSPADWRGLRLVWAVLAVSFGLTQAFAPAGGAFFGACVMWAMIKRPGLIPALILGGVPLVDNVMPVGVKMSVVEVGLLLTGVGAVSSLIKRVGPMLLSVGLYLGVCVVSIGLTYRGAEAISSWVQMVVYLVVAVGVFGRYVREPRQLVLACVALVGTALMLSGLLILIGRGGYVFQINKNSIGGTTGAATIVAAAVWMHRRELGRPGRFALVMVALGVGLFFTLSRGAWFSTFVGVILLAVMYRQWAVVFYGVVLGLVVAAVAYQFLPESQQVYVMSALDTESHSHGTRSENIGKAMHYFWEKPLFGSGLGLRKQYDATNVVVFALAETGMIGLGAFLLIHLQAGLVLMGVRSRAGRDSLVFMAAALAAALLFGRLAHGLVDHYWSRGAISSVWCLLGAAIGLASRAKAVAARPEAQEEAE